MAGAEIRTAYLPVTAEEQIFAFWAGPRLLAPKATRLDGSSAVLQTFPRAKKAAAVFWRTAHGLGSMSSDGSLPRMGLSREGHGRDARRVSTEKKPLNSEEAALAYPRIAFVPFWTLKRMKAGAEKDSAYGRDSVPLVAAFPAFVGALRQLA